MLCSVERGCGRAIPVWTSTQSFGKEIIERKQKAVSYKGGFDECVLVPIFCTVVPFFTLVPFFGVQEHRFLYPRSGFWSRNTRQNHPTLLETTLLQTPEKKGIGVGVKRVAGRDAIVAQ